MSGPVANLGRSSREGRQPPEAALGATMTAPPVRRLPWWLRALTALALFVLAVALVTSSQRDTGVVRDETFYFGAGTRYARWWLDFAQLEDGATSRKAITATFGGPPGGGTNSEHPPLMKTLFGLSELVLHDELGVASEVTAYRFPTALLAGVLLVVVFAWVGAVWGYAEGVVAALLTLFLPRAFFHSGLACFDAPVVTFWVATLYAYWRGLRSYTWALGAGVLWGLTLATKHNALFLPFAIAPHFVWVAVRRHPEVLASRRWRWAASLGRELRERWYLPVAMIVLGPLTLIALWPWLWFDTWAHLTAWWAFHAEHVHYNFEYLGRNWNHPTGRAPVGWYPWHVPIVTTLLTVPAATLAAAALVAGVATRDAIRGDAADGGTAPGVLLALAAAAAFAPFVLGLAPIFGAEKHWGPAIPSLCVAAGIGTVWAARRAAAGVAAVWAAAGGARGQAVAIVAVGGLVVGAAAIETVHAQPYALTHYNAIAGGAPGGADLGMNRGFWGHAARGVADFLRTRPPGPVYSHDASLAWGIYVRDRVLPPGFRDSGPEEGGIAASQYALVLHERHFNRHDYLIWASYGTTQPVYVLRLDGVPIVSVYERPRR